MQDQTRNVHVSHKNCVGCHLNTKFVCHGSMKINILGTLGFRLQKFPYHTIPGFSQKVTKGPTNIEEEIEEEKVKLYHDWRHRKASDENNRAGTRMEVDDEWISGSSGKEMDVRQPNHIEVIPTSRPEPTNNVAKKSRDEEEAVLDLFRTKTRQSSGGMDDTAIFANFLPGPLIADRVFGNNLNTIFSDKEKKEILFKAFNVPWTQDVSMITHVQDVKWRRVINDTRRERDLVIVFRSFACIAYVETKGGKIAKKFKKQFKHFRDYVEHTHGCARGQNNTTEGDGESRHDDCALHRFCFVPILAKHKDSEVDAKEPICAKHVLDIGCELKDLHWTNYFEVHSMNEAEYEKLVKSLLLASSLVLTSLPQISTKNFSESHLIILRETQWNLLSARPKFAVLCGERKTGKSTALELAVAFVGQERRVLVSMKMSNLQNILRKEFFNSTGNTDVSFICKEEIEESTADILARLLGEIRDCSLVCIDDFPATGLEDANVRRQLEELQNKSTHLWIAVNEKIHDTGLNCTILDFNLRCYSIA